MCKYKIHIVENNLLHKSVSTYYLNQVHVKSKSIHILWINVSHEMKSRKVHIYTISILLQKICRIKAVARKISLN